MRTAEAGVTKPAQGVTQARPVTMPVRKPENFGFRLKIQSRRSQVGPAKEAAMSVLMKAAVVIGSTANSLPALKPYQPNQSMAVPRATKGRLCMPLSSILRLPTKRTEAKAAKPAEDVDDHAAREVLDAPGREQSAAPDEMDEGEVDEGEPGDEEDEIGREAGRGS